MSYRLIPMMAAGLMCVASMAVEAQQGQMQQQRPMMQAPAGVVRAELPPEVKIGLLEGKVQQLEGANAQLMQRLAQLDARIAAAEQRGKGAEDAANMVRSVIHSSGGNIAIRASGGLTLEAGGNVELRGKGVVNLRGAAINLN